MNGIADALEYEARLYGELLALLAAKRDALVALKTAEVERLVAQEEALVARLNDADALRRRVSAEAARAAGLPPGATLRQIAVADAALVPLRDRLQKLMVDVARANDLNRALAAQSLAHVREALLVLTGVEPEAAAYTRRGAGTPPPAAGRVNIVDSVA
ncbi:MAG: flagellar protein FlgN [Planctomycetia bacterium]|nr:flagellar protein FlgN [Planctomycetia bacterium]